MLLSALSQRDYRARRPIRNLSVNVGTLVYRNQCSVPPPLDGAGGGTGGLPCDCGSSA